MSIKQFLGKIHLWIGLITGILFFLIALSGAVYTWEPEISRIIYKQKVAPQSTPFAQVSVFKAKLDEAFPQGDFRTILFRDKKTAVQVLLYGQGTYYHPFLNPYSGKLLHIQDMNTGWLNYVKFLHRNLILGKVGRQIVHWLTFLALIMIISGIVLWWPVNKKARKGRFKVPTWLLSTPLLATSKNFSYV